MLVVQSSHHFDVKLEPSGEFFLCAMASQLGKQIVMVKRAHSIVQLAPTVPHGASTVKVSMICVLLPRDRKSVV